MVGGTSGFEQKDPSTSRVQRLPPLRWPSLTTGAQTIAAWRFPPRTLGKRRRRCQAPLSRTSIFLFYRCQVDARFIQKNS